MRAIAAVLSLSLLLQGFPVSAAQMFRGGALGSGTFAPVVLPSQALAPVLGASGSIKLGAPAPTLSVPSALAPSPIVAPQGGVAVPDAAPAPVAPQGALPSLQAISREASAPAAMNQNEGGYDAASKAFDGSGEQGRALEPVFEPSVYKPAPPQVPGAVEGENEEEAPRRPNLSFPSATRGSLMAVEPGKSIFGAIKRVRDFEGSRVYWAQFKKGAEIDILSKGEDVFGRTTTITKAASKKIGRLTREDFAGTVPAHQLKAPIRKLRQMLIDQLEDKRRSWNPNDPPITLKSSVRVIKFKSFLDLYKETHGPDSVPEAEVAAARVPLKVKPEGALKSLSLFLPRAIYLDLDLFDGPIAKELLSDLGKLMRTGVYVVAFSRKPFAAQGSLKDKLIRQLSSYQLGTLMPIRFMAVTDDGGVISSLPRGGSITPVDVAAFSDAEVEVLRDAAGKAAEEAGLSPRSLREQSQPAIKERADEIPGFERKKTAPVKDPRVRFELHVPKSVSEAALKVWLMSLERRLKSHDLALKTKVTVLENGQRSVTLQKTDLGSSLSRLNEALGDKFGLYLNPSDILVLSDDPALKAANPGLDLGVLTGLKGSELAENALGLMLGEHRENQPGDLSGSASRMASFTYDRTRYMSEFLIKQDGQEQNINFFSGHTVHSAMDWLVYELQNGKRPTEKEFADHLQDHWRAGLREFKPVGIPQGEDMEGWLRESTQRGISMYRMVTAIHDRGEILIGTEIPNFFMVKDFQKRSGELKRRYVLHTIFDFIALRPDPKNPGHAALVIYDFKTGPAQSRQKLDKDVQVLTYAYFANQKWVGQTMPAPYLSGSKGYVLDEARVEFIYNAIKQPTTITRWDLETIRKKIIGTLTRIAKSEQQMLGELPAKKAVKKKPAAKKAAKKK